MDIAAKVSLILGLLLTVLNVIDRCRKYSTGAYKAKKNKENLQNTVDGHTSEIKELKDIVNALVERFDNYEEILKVQIRHSIVHTCTECMNNEYIEQYQLQALEDMYTVYTDILKGNSYVCTLMKRVRKLEIRNGD